MGVFVHNLDPVLVDFGGVQIRYYGLMFVLTLLGGYVLWRWQMRRGGHPEKVIDAFILWGFLAVVIGARLGHVFFYHPGKFLADPVTILFVWQGGLASHGATVGLIAALWLFAKRYRLSPLETWDRFTFSAALGAAGVRMGNFLNSEIVGRVTDAPWGVWFQRFDATETYRHPSQLYEFALGLAVLGLLGLVDRLAGRERRPRGLMLGVFLASYFAGRFAVEFFKAYHIDSLQDRSPLTMGQWLSVPPFLIGSGLIVWSLRRGRKNQPDGQNPPANETKRSNAC